MSESVLLAIVIAVALVTVVALYLNRRLKITSPKGSVEVGSDQPGPSSMTVSASGAHSMVEGSKQIQRGAGPAMKIAATDGGKVVNQEQRSTDK
ncbi:MAG: hypothetical protein QOK37_4007 [Thermoanaerobaculia bacterium]|jgi:hypothetical protein|nr:hypothetical protein [Thermoanaerobaculia bacterium]